MYKTYIVAGFPGVGKTTFCDKYRSQYQLFDSDSSKHKEDWPNEYLKFIYDVNDLCCNFNGTNKPSFIFVSTHKEVLEGLIKFSLPFILVAPKNTEDNKRVWLNRFRDRGSPDAFISLLNNKWDDFMKDIREISKSSLVTYIELDINSEKMYIEDIIKDFL